MFMGTISTSGISPVKKGSKAIDKNPGNNALGYCFENILKLSKYKLPFKGIF